jgi:hypothetical protein
MGDGDVRRYAPATLRNRDAITAVLNDVLPPSGLVLEVASGSGEHIAHFAREVPGHDWQPSDPDPDARASIAAWCAGLDAVRPPLVLDATAPDWPIARAEAVLCINMVHISPWEATLGLFAGAAGILPQGAPLILYGPYRREGVETAPSNEAFDESLRARDPRWGLRNVEAVRDVASGFAFERLVEMPANNLMLVFRRT